ncbi:MAG: D-alanyl-D-alanine carboxypeptidase family protein [Alphaproteobacteria bacterium]
MVRPIRRGIVAAALLAGACAAWTIDAPAEAAVKKAEPVPTRYAAIVIDDATGRVLHQVNADDRRYPASLTKMMTIYMAFEAIEKKRLGFDTKLKISQHAANQAPSRIGLAPGDNFTVRQAILALVTKSANDAATALGETIAGTEAAFAAQMTKRAQALGMRNTVFKNANGLPDPQQVSTARDLATLSRALRRDFPQHYHFFATREFTYKGVTIANHNRVLNRLEGADGLKTGYIRASGFNLASSATRDGRRLVGVVLGGESGTWRDARMVQLMEQAFDNTITSPAPAMVAGVNPPPAKPALPSSHQSARADAEMDSAMRAAGLTDPALAFEQGDTESMVALAAPQPRYSLPRNPGNEWAIQVGAFSRAAPAQQAASQAKSKLPKTLAAARVTVLDGAEDGSKFFRARLTGLTEATARSACRQLEQRGMGCITVAPEVGSNRG